MIESGLMKCRTGIHFLARYNTSRNVEQTLDLSRNPREKSGAIHARCRRLKCSVLGKSGSFSACPGYDARTGGQAT
jgi:hypothetical protein